MPADADEQLAPATVPPTAPRQQAKPVAPPATPATGFAWGVVGYLHEAAELTAVPGSRGVVRYVGGVSYAAPPLAGGWKPTPGTPGRYEMPWPGDPATARTLTHLRADLDQGVRSGALKSGLSPLLAELDAAGGGLLDAAGKLHAAGWTLGLLSPGTVALTASHEPHLIDLGYTWQGSFGPPPWEASPGRPAWLDDAAKWLSDVPAVRRQFADPSGKHFPRVEPAEDVRTLARLFAWLLTGQPRGEVVAPSRGPAPELWALLAEASAGRVPTARDFRDRLANAPLSGHFTEHVAPPPAPTPVTPVKPAPAGGVPWLPVLAGVAALAVVAGGLAVAFWPSGGADSVAVTPTAEPAKPVEVPAVAPPRTPADFAEDLKKLDAALAKRELPVAAKVLKEVYAAGPIAPADDSARQARREQYVDLCVGEYKAALALSRQPSRRYDAVAQLRAIEAQLKSLADGPPLPPGAATLHEKEKQGNCRKVIYQHAGVVSEIPDPIRTRDW